METVRWFSAEVESLARFWREVVVDTNPWVEVEAEPGFAHGEAAGFFVNCGPLDGYGKQSGASFRAAHEKVAADLGFELGLPIPPVVLTEPDGRLCSVSAIPFPGPQKWGTALQAPESVSILTPRLLAASSAMEPFDTWVGNSDRHNEGNLIVSRAIEGGGIAYIDYSNSLTHSWQAGPAPPIVQSIGRYPALGDIEIKIVRETIDKIEALDGQIINSVVDRVPEAYLPADRKKALSEALLSRRGDLRGVFETQYGGSK